METIRVNICYRPLRIAWALHSRDREAFREAVRLTHTLWGGRFNPIIMVWTARKKRNRSSSFSRRYDRGAVSARVGPSPYPCRETISIDAR